MASGCCSLPALALSAVARVEARRTNKINEKHQHHGAISEVAHRLAVDREPIIFGCVISCGQPDQRFVEDRRGLR